MQRFKITLLIIVLIMIVAVCVVVFRSGPETPVRKPDTNQESISILDLIDVHHLAVQNSAFSFSAESGFQNPILNPAFIPGLIELGPNWGHIEPLGTWAIGQYSLLRVHFRKPRKRHLIVHCKSRKHPSTSKHQTISVSCNGHDCGTINVSRFMSRHTLVIPEEAQREGRNTFTFQYGFHVSPHEFGIGEDQRELAVLFKKIAFSVDDEEDETQVFGQNLTIDRTGDAIIFVDREELVVPVSLPATVTELAFGLSFSIKREQNSPVIRIHGEFLDGSRIELYDFGSVATQQEHRDISGVANLSAFRGQSCFLIFEVDPGSGGEVTIKSPTIHKNGAARQRLSYTESAGQSPTDPVVQPRPDIVLVILDAARKDHFGCYGYPRATSPNIDDFSEDALVFSNAFALAPYTLCSVPTMITGASFIEHGVTQHMDRLSEEWTTIAEVLQANGYRTISYSATPNNSKSKGFDQGFDEFYELWKGVNSETARDPHRLSALAEEMLNKDDGKKPLFLQLHYIPPHEPYDPGPRFDVFGETDYRGSCDGSLETAGAINRGEYLADAADISEIISLYDGNLRKGDDALSSVFRALKSRGKWEQTIVLVTSDHGEAFQEHGWIGHNENCYDEMLHVPFILKLQAGVATDVIEQKQLITLADIKPTLCALAKCASTDSRFGLDIFAPLPSPGDRKNRFFVSRNSYMRPEFAIRTLRWKLVMNRSGAGELYDTISDPSEKNNKVLDDPAVFSGLLTLMQQRLMTSSGIPRTDTIQEISDEDRTMLEALGYLN